MTIRVLIVGAGGQSREVRWILREIAATGGPFEYAGCVVSDLERVGRYDSADEILGDYRWMRSHRDRFDALALGIGSPAARLRVARELEPEFPADWWPAIVHPSAIFDRETAVVQHGALIHPGVVGTVNLRIGAYAMVNNACTLGHEASIGDGCVVNPGANISGGVTLGEGVLVGTGAQVLQYLRVGDRATVGAGAVVTRDVPAGLTVVGVPARPVSK